MGRDASGMLKSANSATDNSYNIENNRVASCVICVLCLFLTVQKLTKRPQSMRQIEQPLVQKLIAKRPKLMPYKK